MKRIVIGWDYDHTKLNTERKLFGPVLRDIAEFMNMPFAEVSRVFNEVNAKTFSWLNWFLALGMDRETAAWMQARCEADVANRIEECLYPGIADLQRRLQLRYGDRLIQVLITAGDPEYQAWKFGCTPCLHEIIRPEHRHFVPLDGSKADALALYDVGETVLLFIDDSARWHSEVIDCAIIAQHIRPQWPDTDGTKPHAFDGVYWTVTTTIEELEVAIEAAIARAA